MNNGIRKIVVNKLYEQNDEIRKIEIKRYDNSSETNNTNSNKEIEKNIKGLSNSVLEKNTIYTEFKSKFKELKKLNILYKNKEFVINNHGELCYKKNDKNIPLCNFIIIPIAEVIVTDEINIEKEIELMGILNNKYLLKNIRVKLNELRNFNWIEERWGFKCSIYPVNRCYEKIRHAIKIASEKIKVKYVYKHIGWTCLNNKYIYLLGNAVIGDKNSNVIIDESMRKFNLKIDYELSREKAYRKSLKLLEIAPLNITLPIFCFTLLSTINTLLKYHSLEPKFCLWLSGETGSRKTTISNLFTNIFNNNVPANFKDTKTALEIKMFEYKDSVLIVDDYHPTDKISEKQDMESKAELILRFFGDRISKSRSNVNLGKQKELRPRGLCLITGEDFIEVKSNMARCINISINRNDIDLNKLSKRQENPLEAPTIIYYFIKWIAKYMNNNGELPNIDLNNFRNNLRVKNLNIHGRLIDAVWFLRYAYHLYLMYGLELGVIDDNQLNQRLNLATNIFMKIAINQEIDMKTEDPLFMYLKALNELIISNKIFLCKKGNSNNTIKKFGWYDDEYYYLLPEITYNEVCNFWKKRNKNFPLTLKKLHNLLYANGIIDIDEGSNRKCVKVTMSKHERPRVLKINKMILEKHI
ncbi:hypothetical protein A0J52_17680 [Clostridium sporogenes]|uniref:hypothetical protein n=1 Tax=Clostridium sporogenes TaxID=1509 RepID=UPI0007801143|nr:hypothetical protein [Clostridium sporogenes]KYN75803.1 hypothetical protein A0J52_17680 [Clostridium sporogenes]